MMTNDLVKKTLKGYDAFDLPDYLQRVTAGTGGEAFLFFAKEVTVLHDCGMAYCYKGLIENIEKALADHGRDHLDYILLSHTHYDHVGALPYVLQRFPNATVIGAYKAEKVFQSEGARRTMRRLGEAARDQYSDSEEEVLTDGLRVDYIAKDGDMIELGNGEHIKVIESTGHTDCSLAYLLLPHSLMFTSESTGIPRPFGDLHTSILKNYHQTIEAAKKCKAEGAKHLLVPHYGLLPEELVEEYFDIYIDFAESEKNFIIGKHDEGMDYDQIMKAYEGRYWSDKRSENQPKEAFLENAQHIVRHILQLFRNE
ncbi:MAG: MBL fold metallo-hydrolase [Firmicutes bacterium]|nr:MBL fold metallo-hydrolase [Bacillota bacterium]